MFHSIRLRIALPFAALFVATMIGLGLYLSAFLRQTYLNELENQLQGEATLLADQLAPLMSQNVPSSEINSLTRHWSSLLNTRVTIIAPDGTVIGESQQDPNNLENHLTRPEISAAIASGQGSSIRFSNTVGYPMLYLALPVKKDSRVLGVVRLSQPLSQVDANIANLQRGLAGATLLATLLVLLLASIIASRTTRPLRDLTEAARRMSGGALDAHLTRFQPDGSTAAFADRGAGNGAQQDGSSAERDDGWGINRRCRRTGATTKPSGRANVWSECQ
jgi:two-component system phosphate regulon sensor histidine kinase PhoR